MIIAIFSLALVTYIFISDMSTPNPYGIPLGRV